jgi:sec-independent protein translocase protein TatA
MTGKIEGVIVLILIVLLLFGSKRIPELARSIGSSVKEVKNGFNGVESKTETAEDKKED